ncbi:MAG: beta-propeller fold lactonase family protein [Chlamydiia bacterium]
MRICFCLILSLFFTITSPLFSDLFFVPNVPNTLAGNSVSVIDANTNTVVNTISSLPERQPINCAFSKYGEFLYVANFFSDTISVINTDTYTVVATIPVGDAPIYIAATPDGSRIYVCNAQSSSISVIDVATYTVIDTLILSGAPRVLAFSPDGTFAYVTIASVPSNITRILNTDTATPSVGTQIPLGDGAWGLTFNSDGSLAFATSATVNLFYVIDPTTDTVIHTISAGVRPFYISINPVNGLLYSPNQNSNNVNVIDISVLPPTIVATIPANATPKGIAFSEDGLFAYVANQASDIVTILDLSTNTIFGTIPVGEGPYSITAFPPPYVPGGIESPTYFSAVKLKNNFATCYEYYAELQWSMPLNSPEYYGFNVYRNGELIASLDATTFKYYVHNLSLDGGDLLGVTFRGINGESLPAQLNIR